MFINCQTITVFKLLIPFFTLSIFTVKHLRRRKSLLKNTRSTFCIHHSDVTKPLFLRIRFWAVIHASRHWISFSLQPTANSLLPRYLLFFNHRQPFSLHFSTNRRYFPSTPSMRLNSSEYAFRFLRLRVLRLNYRTENKKNCEQYLLIWIYIIQIINQQFTKYEPSPSFLYLQHSILHTHNTITITTMSSCTI